MLKLKATVRNLLPDWLLMRIEFLRHIGYWPNLRAPRAYSEILLSKLLRDDGKANAHYADKVTAREFVRERIGEKYLVPAALVTSDPMDLTSTSLPKGVAVKSSAGSGMVRIVRDTTTVDWGSLVPEFSRWLGRDYSRRHREKVYSHLAPRLLVEELLESGDLSLPDDYKVYVFKGQARFLQYISGRGVDIRQTMYFPDGRPMPSVSKGFPVHDEPPLPAADFVELVRVAEALAADIDFVRVDLYWVSGRVYFGEMTFYPGAIRTEFKPREFDEELGSVWLHGGRISDKWASHV